MEEMLEKQFFDTLAGFDNCVNSTCNYGGALIKKMGSTHVYIFDC